MPAIALPEQDEDTAYDVWRQRQVDAETFPEIAFDEELHEYRINGAKVPSVTEVLKPIITVGGSEAVREHKRQLGKAVDKAIELYEQDDLDVESLDPEAVPFFEGWLKFRQDTGFRGVIMQPVVWSTRLRCAGKPDLLGNRGQTRVVDELLDVKCVWTIDPATAIQTAGYTLLGAESHGWKIKRRGSVQLLRDGKYSYHPYTNPNDEHVFKSLLNIHAWKALQK